MHIAFRGVKLALKIMQDKGLIVEFHRRKTETKANLEFIFQLQLPKVSRKSDNEADANSYRKNVTSYRKNVGQNAANPRGSKAGAIPLDSLINKEGEMVGLVGLLPEYTLEKTMPKDVRKSKELNQPTGPVQKSEETPKVKPEEFDTKKNRCENGME